MRGDVVRLRPPAGAGHEQRGARLGVVLQSDALAPLSTLIVAPTSRSALAATFRPEITVGGETTRVLVEQLGAVDVRRANERVGTVSVEELWAIDDALALVVGLH
ncbi:MAG: type II toxin-antitoxin system PemK/MazF family toxin [Acidobacteriota bacterium]|nr:type II toxin-antitoxin system PemK/MazF family toxin [Acidobacteriota bacterium]MDE3044962.1 type II toxin-antitoxin system PemK/MazF family toxin [Acidobacteriota bacterium]MDE3108055.1 type II toxin-antitoxin system PemK/MazF family toxin [Acidobacteriota bacterium]